MLRVDSHLVEKRKPIDPPQMLVTATWTKKITKNHQKLKEGEVEFFSTSKMIRIRA